MKKKASRLMELKNIFGNINGEVRLHFESDDAEPEHFTSLDSCLKYLDETLDKEQTVDNINRLVYIISEEEYQREQAEIKAELNACGY